MRTLLLALKVVIVKLMLMPVFVLASDWVHTKRTDDGRILTTATLPGRINGSESPAVLSVQCVQSRPMHHIDISISTGQYLGITDGKHDPRLIARIGDEPVRWHTVTSQDGYSLSYSGSEKQKQQRLIKMTRHDQVALKIWDHRGAVTKAKINLTKGRQALQRIMETCGLAAA